MKRYTVPTFWWLILPVFFILAQIVLEISFDRQTMANIMSEQGPHEALQAIFSGLAFLFAIYLLPKIDWRRQKLIGAAVVIAALGTFYITGEELSWGQQILHWNTPEYWAQFNDQDETNLHNTSSWLDQKPRALLYIGIIVAGLIVPTLRRWKPQWLPARYAEIYPSDILIPAALGAFVPYTAEAIIHLLFHVKLFARVSEVQELYMYYFVLIYLLDLNKREISQD